MDGSTSRTFEVNELTPDPRVEFDPKVAASYVTYAHRLAARGLVNSSVGGMVIRVPHPDHADGICYAKPQGVSLEEVEAEVLVITDIPWGRILRGTVSEAYHRTCVLVSEVKRNIIVETLCAVTGKTPEYISDEDLSYMAQHGDAVMYPGLIKRGRS